MNINEQSLLENLSLAMEKEHSGKPLIEIYLSLAKERQIPLTAESPELKFAFITAFMIGELFRLIEMQRNQIDTLKTDLKKTLSVIDIMNGASK